MVAVQVARKGGLDAAYLVPAEDRTYLEEYSAEWVLELAVAVMQGMTQDIATGIGAYLWERAKYVVGVGHHSGPVESVPMRLGLARYEREADGAVRIDNLVIEGSPENVEAAVRALVGHAATPELVELDAHEVDQDGNSSEED
ncbi:hypothetical protein [Planosporangium thailandense]|uniref:hypothetical protein n=1 Tax=Planosporangium thailandense TaxID=765197 RepID=UPI00197C3D33|nr:hypothetical protein [Planosporangium thailandense]